MARLPGWDGARSMTHGPIANRPEIPGSRAPNRGLGAAILVNSRSMLGRVAGVRKDEPKHRGVSYRYPPMSREEVRGGTQLNAIPNQKGSTSAVPKLVAMAGP